MERLFCYNIHQIGHIQAQTSCYVQILLVFVDIAELLFLHMSKQSFFTLKRADYWTFYNTFPCICPKQNITSFHSVVYVKCRPSRLSCCELSKAFCVFC